MAKKKKTERKPLNIEWNLFDIPYSKFPTNIIVQKFQENFKVLLFEIKPDILLTEEDREEMEKRGTIRADCIASFILTPHNLRKFVGVMNEQLDRYDEEQNESSSSK